jgi:hypothetical protein
MGLGTFALVISKKIHPKLTISCLSKSKAETGQVGKGTEDAIAYFNRKKILVNFSNISPHGND